MCVRFCTILLLFLFIPHRSFQFRLSQEHNKAARTATNAASAEKSQLNTLSKKRTEILKETDRKEFKDIKLKHEVGTARRKESLSLEAFKVPLITLILVKLVNIKFLAALTLLGILVIKKALLAAALFVPVVLGKLKGLIHKEDDHVYIHHEHDHLEQHGDWIKRYSHYRK